MESSKKSWFKKVLFVNGTITVVFNDGELVTAENISDETYNLVNGLEDKEEIKAILIPELRKTFEENSKIREANKEFEELATKLVDSGQFEFKDNQVYYKGINLPIPVLLLKFFAENLDNQQLFNSYLNFWMWLSLNPNIEAREGTFDFIKRYKFKVTSHGFLLAYRRVVSTKSDNEDYIKAISNSYIKVKTIWKKSPKNFTVIKKEDNTYSIEKIEDYPNANSLIDQYLELPSLQQMNFTDNHTKTFDIKIGSKVTMDRKDCDEDGKRDCSSGLHYCSNLKDYTSFGNTSILLAVNPRDIVSVPESQTSKSRCSAYFPIAILDGDEETILDDSNCEDLLDEFFNEELELLKTQSFENTRELRKHYIISDLKETTFIELVRNISDIKTKLKESYIVK